MSNWAAIAAATEGFQRWLQQDVANHFNGSCTTVRPDQIKDDVPAINLFLYQVCFNHGFLNIDQPQRRSDGSRLTQALTAVDLHYMITCAAGSEIVAQLLLAQTVRIINAHPFIARDVIADAAAASSNPHVKNSELADQTECIRVTPVNLGVEGLAKIWGLYPDTPYRLSLGYVATTIVLEGDDKPEPALPVQAATVSAGPLLAPKLASVQVEANGAALTLVLNGEGFTQDCSVVVDGSNAVVANPIVSGNQIRVPLGADDFPGLFSAHVEREAQISGRSFTVASESQAYIVRPLVDTVQRSGANVTVKTLRTVDKEQVVAVLLSPIAGGASIALEVPARPAKGKTLKASLAGVDPGTYLVRLRVDNASSISGVTGVPPTPTPTVVVP